MSENNVIDESQLIFLDLETTGLDPAHHQIWEVGCIVDGEEHEWQLYIDLSKADAGALRVNRFYERAVQWSNWHSDQREWANAGLVAYELTRMTAGRMVVGAVPSFDVAFLEPFIRRAGYCPAWSHRLICVETLAAGVLKTLPKGLRQMAEGFGITFEDGARHTALGDARVARASPSAVC